MKIRLFKKCIHINDGLIRFISIRNDEQKGIEIGRTENIGYRLRYKIFNYSHYPGIQLTIKILGLYFRYNYRGYYNLNGQVIMED